jgi:RimJ/RimL family protein N-acetyltransferase
MIGDVNLFVNEEDPTAAEIEVMIAEKCYRRQGYGREALSIMLAYGTQELAVSSFTAKISLKNEPSLSLFQTLGFQYVCTSEIFQEIELRLTADDQSGYRSLNLKRGKYKSPL